MTLRKALLLALAFILSLGGAALAAPRNLPDGFVIGDTEGLQVDDHGTYYIHETGLRPGDTITKRIRIRNTERDIPYTLTLSSVPMERTGPIDLLDRIHMVMKLDGKVLYAGRLYGDAGVDLVKTPLDLGVYAYDDEATLDIQLTFEKNIPDELLASKSTAEVGWIFRAVKYRSDEPRPIAPEESNAIGVITPSNNAPTPERAPTTTPKATPKPLFPFLPRTGDESQITVMIAVLLLSIIVAEWIVYRRYRDRFPRK